MEMTREVMITDQAGLDQAAAWEPAPAKLNLYLHVGPPEADGRHPLDSLVMFADHGDRLSVLPGEPGRPLTLTVSGPFSDGLSTGDDNLVLRAANSLRAAAGQIGLAGCAPAHLHLEKNLPVASGIGGGSADAAAALRALNHFWGTGFSLPDLARIAASLGADVPACIFNSTAHMTGTGEKLAPARAPGLFAVLANMLVPVPTGPVYRRFDALNFHGQPSTFPPGNAFIPAPLPSSRNAADFIAALHDYRNDLEAAALSIEPAIGQCLDALRRLTDVRLIRMSGSGGTCFALFESMEQAQLAAKQLLQREPDWWAVACRLGIEA